jgi:hypothetical protein
VVRVRRESGFRGLFYDLCVELGFCLPPDDVVRLTDAPPPDVEAFTEAVLLAEGFDPPALCDLRLRRQVRDLIHEHLDFSGSR